MTSGMNWWARGRSSWRAALLRFWLPAVLLCSGCYGSNRAPKKPEQPVDHSKIVLQGHEQPVDAAAFSPDGNFVATGSFDNTVKLWDAATGELKHTLRAFPQEDPEDEYYPVESLDFSPDGRLFASGHGNGWVVLWDLSTRKPIWLFDEEDGFLIVGPSREGFGSVPTLKFSPDGKYLAISHPGVPSAAVSLWDLKSRERVHRLAHDGLVEEMDFNGDGSMLATVTWMNTVRVWDVATGTATSLPSHRGPVFSVAFDPRGHLVASGDGRYSASMDEEGRITTVPSNTGEILISDAATGELLHRFRAHEVAVQSLDFSHDGRWLASSGQDKKIKIWDTESWELLQTFFTEPVSYESLDATVVEFSPDGTRLLIANTPTFSATIRILGDER